MLKQLYLTILLLVLVTPAKAAFAMESIKTDTFIDQPAVREGIPKRRISGSSR